MADENITRTFFKVFLSASWYWPVSTPSGLLRIVLWPSLTYRVCGSALMRCRVWGKPMTIRATVMLLCALSFLCASLSRVAAQEGRYLVPGIGFGGGHESKKPETKGGKKGQAAVVVPTDSRDATPNSVKRTGQGPGKSKFYDDGWNGPGWRR